jgi:predicted RNA-binding protein with PUA domain
MLDNWTPELVRVDDAIEMGFVAIRPDNSMFLKKESAEILMELIKKGLAVDAKNVEQEDEKRWLVACGVKHFVSVTTGYPVDEDSLIRDSLLRERDDG